MKVLHVIPSIGPLRGGPSFALLSMAGGLVRAGINVHIATTDDNGQDRLAVPLGQPILKDGVTTHYFRRQTQLYTGSQPLASWLRTHIRDYDLLHIHSLFSYSSTVAGIYARRAKVPYIVRPLGHLNQWGMQGRRRWVKAASLRLVENRLLQGAAYIHYTSNQELKEAKLSGVQCSSFVLPLGIDEGAMRKPVDCEPFLARHPILKDRFVLLFLSRLHSKKGFDLLLPALTALRDKHPQIALILAGEGDESFVRQLNQQIEELGLNDVIVRTGFLSGDEKIQAFRVADVFVLPSYSENFANAVVEAMTVGLPVVISDPVGISDAVRETNAGLVVPCRVAELHDALDRLINDAALRHTLGSNGRYLVENQFTIRATTRALISKYRDILHLKSTLSGL